MPGHIYIFFSSTGPQRSWPVRASRLLVRLLSRSPIDHCAPGDGDITIDPSFTRDTLWRTEVYAARYPGLKLAIRVPTDRPVLDADLYRPKIKRRLIPPGLRWATFGWYHADDCLFLCQTALCRAGVHVPRRITTPRSLAAWLRRQGYEAIEVA